MKKIPLLPIEFTAPNRALRAQFGVVTDLLQVLCIKKDVRLNHLTSFCSKQVLIAPRSVRVNDRLARFLIFAFADAGN